MNALPKDWRSVPLGHCCQIVSGSTPRRNRPEYWDGDISWVTPKDLSHLSSSILNDSPEKITQAGYQSCSAKLMPRGSILFSSRAPIGHVAIAGKDMCTNQGFKSLIPGDLVRSSYLYWCMRKYANNIKALGSGTTFKEVSKGIVERFEIPLPPLDEQRRIAAILDKADAVRRKRKEAIALTEDLLRSVFLEMFGDPVTNPKAWKAAPLEDFCLIQSGIAKGKKVDSSKTIAVPYMRVANVQDGYLNLSEIKEINVLPSDIDRYVLKPGDVLLTEGGDPDKLGRGAIWNGEVQPCIHQNHIFCVRPDVSIAEPAYLSALIGSERGKRFFLRAAKQTTGIATINKTQLKSFPALLPPRSIQINYLDFSEKLRSASSRSKEHLAQSDNLFNSLLQRAFRGDL